MSDFIDKDRWINLSLVHEREIYDLQGKIADLAAENERLRKAGDVMYRYVGKSPEHSIQMDRHDKSKRDWLAAKEGTTK